jgi:hypothetical protein
MNVQAVLNREARPLKNTGLKRDLRVADPTEDPVLSETQIAFDLQQISGQSAVNFNTSGVYVVTVTSISYIGIPVSQSLGEGGLQLFRRLGNSLVTFRMKSIAWM